MAFHCPEGTRFQQRAMICDHARLVQCQDSGRFYHANLRIGQRNLKLIDDFEGNVMKAQVVRYSREWRNEAKD